MKNKHDAIDLFHHIHHKDGEHAVHHCGGKHADMDPSVNYTISHCPCGKHQIDKETAIGHDFDMNNISVKFTEKCPAGGWHIEGGLE